jgi:hypothetical protein
MLNDNKYSHWNGIMNQKYIQNIKSNHLLVIWKVTEQLKVILKEAVRARGSVVVKALCYKPEGRGFDTWLNDFFKFT